MNTRNRSNNRSFRNKALVGAIVAALALGTAGAATAQSAQYTLDPSTLPSWSQVLSLQNYLHTVGNSQTLTGNVSASFPTSSSIFDTYSGSGSPQTVSGNTLSALAVGNNATGAGNPLDPNNNAGNSIDMLLLGSNGAPTPSQGLGILSGQLNFGNTVSSSANGASVATTLTGYSAGSATQNDNTIRADTVMNDASSVISGHLPAAAYTGAAAGGFASVNYNIPPTTSGMASSGDIVVGNAQANVGTTGSGASANTDNINITDTVGGSATFSNSANTIADSYVGNRSANGIEATGADGAPSFNGAAVVNNGQANLGAPATTTANGNSISTSLGGTLTGTGSITQSGDRISAGTQGNTASNALTFAQGINIAGTDTNAAEGLSVAFGFSTVSMSGKGDLIEFNTQGNQNGTSFTTSANGNNIVATAGAVAATGTSVTVGDGHVQAVTGGNDATNTLSANGASFQANVLVGNQQVNDNVAMTSTAATNRIGSYMDSATASQGNVSVSSSSVDASVQGNRASTQVDVAGTNFQSGGGNVASAGNSETAGFIGASTGNAGVSVVNLQGNYGAGLTIGASNDGGWIGAYYSGNITNGASTVSGNAVTAQAGGNAADTSAALSGANGAFAAALSNSQYNANNVSATIGTTDAAYQGIYVDAGSVSNAPLTVNDNRSSASANGNQASNSLSSDFTNASVGDGATAFGGASVGITNLEQASDKGNTANAALALASTQWSDGSTLTASNTDSQTGVLVGASSGGNLTDAPVTVNHNSASATAITNQVTNTIDPGVGNLVAVGGNATQVASLGNLQHANGNTVNATVSLAAVTDPAMIGAVATGNVLRSAVTVSDNSVSAFAGGNMAGNGIAVTGSNYAPGAVTGDNGLSYEGDGSPLNATAAFTLVNGQDSEGNSRSASVTNGTMGAASLGYVNASPLTVNGNQVNADARDNYASNALSFGGFSTLTTTGAVLSEQFGLGTPVSSSISGTSIAAGSLANYVLNSDVTVSGNGLTAKAIGNTVFNSFAVQAGQLSGNSNDYSTYAGLRGAVWGVTDPYPIMTLADYGLTNYQYHTGAVQATITDGQIGGGAGTNFNGGSLTVSSNTQTAVAQSNSGINTLSLDATSTDASAAVNNFQTSHENSDATASVTSDYAFSAYADGALGTTAVVPVTVNNNTMVAQAGQNNGTNTLNVNGVSAINGTVAGSGASTDSTTYDDYAGALADYALYSFQSSYSGASATADAGVVGLEVAGGAIGRNGTTSGLTVSGNQIIAQASVNSAGNAINLTGASSIGATTALGNDQSAHGTRAGGNTFNPATVDATVSATHVGIYDDTAANVSSANLSVSGNTLSASASGNSASNSINVQAVALNTGSAEATAGSSSSVLNTANAGYPRVAGTALASNALLNTQVNEDTISATVSNSDIGVNSTGGPGGSSPLLNSSATVGGNNAAASASGNGASNSIMLASLPSGVASSSLVSNQVNTADISATASNVHIGVNAGATSSSPVTVSGNTISATAVGNSATNHIGISN